MSMNRPVNIPEVYRGLFRGVLVLSLGNLNETNYCR